MQMGRRPTVRQMRRDPAREATHGCCFDPPRFPARHRPFATLLAGRPAAAAGRVRVALGDVLSTETLCVQLALERAKERGVDYELTSFSKEDLAIQAMIGGQTDLGIGTPYAVI